MPGTRRCHQFWDYTSDGSRGLGLRRARAQRMRQRMHELVIGARAPPRRACHGRRCELCVDIRATCSVITTNVGGGLPALSPSTSRGVWVTAATTVRTAPAWSRMLGAGCTAPGGRNRARRAGTRRTRGPARPPRSTTTDRRISRATTRASVGSIAAPRMMMIVGATSTNVVRRRYTPCVAAKANTTAGRARRGTVAGRPPRRLGLVAHVRPFYLSSAATALGDGHRCCLPAPQRQRTTSAASVSRSTKPGGQWPMRLRASWGGLRSSRERRHSSPLGLSNRQGLFGFRRRLRPVGLRRRLRPRLRVLHPHGRRLVWGPMDNSGGSIGYAEDCAAAVRAYDGQDGCRGPTSSTSMMATATARRTTASSATRMRTPWSGRASCTGPAAGTARATAFTCITARPAARRTERRTAARS